MEKDNLKDNILLTGSNGFLGSFILEELNSKYNVFTLNRVYSDFNVDLSKSVPTFNKSFNYIIHCAGLAHGNFTEKQFIDVNIIGTQNLLEAINECETLPSHFIFMSSVSVYGLHTGYQILEDHKTLANDPYGKSKLEAEKIIIDWCNLNNINCTILRLPLIVGPKPPGNLGSMIKSIEKGIYFNINGGTSRRSMVLAKDVARYLIISSKHSGIFNLTDGYHPSFFELSQAIALKFKKKNISSIPFFIVKLLAIVGDIVGEKFPINSHKLSKILYNLTFDDTKARKVFGWSPNSVLDYFKSS